jgi:hypothetical protein
MPMTSVVAPSRFVRASTTMMRGELLVVTEILTGALTASLRELPQQSSWPPHPNNMPPTRG